MNPSDLYSIAGETIEFANPVIGTIEPAPAIFPTLLNMFKAVKNMLKNINDIDTIEIMGHHPYIINSDGFYVASADRNQVANNNERFTLFSFTNPY